MRYVVWGKKEMVRTASFFVFSSALVVVDYFHWFCLFTNHQSVLFLDPDAVTSTGDKPSAPKWFSSEIKSVGYRDPSHLSINERSFYRTNLGLRKLRDGNYYLETFLSNAAEPVLGWLTT